MIRFFNKKPDVFSLTTSEVFLNSTGFTVKYFEVIADWSDRLGPDLFLPIFYPERQLNSPRDCYYLLEFTQ